jgi:dephospho-CoA kinase
VKEDMENLDNAIVVAITGGIGSGKTSAARLIEEAGFPVIYTDELAKEIMNSNSIIKKKITDSFGENSYNADGEVNNQYMASIVFDEGEKAKNMLEKLNMIVHPPVIDAMIENIEKLIEKGHKLIFVESALIFEASLDEGFDYIITVDTPIDIIFNRFEEKGITKQQIENRMREQLTTQFKKETADFVIENKGTKEELKNAVIFVLNILKEIVK